MRLKKDWEDKIEKIEKTRLIRLGKQDWKRLRRKDWEDKIEKKDWKDWKNKIE